MEKSNQEKTIPKSIVFLEAGIILYRLCQRLGNMNCLLQSISNNVKFIKKVQLGSKVNQVKSQGGDYGFRKGRHLHYNVEYDTIH